MMAEYKNTPLELDNTMPKELYEIVENKWHYFLQIEKESQIIAYSSAKGKEGDKAH